MWAAASGLLFIFFTFNELPRFTLGPRNLWGDSTGGQQTALIGGSGGSQFESTSSTGQPVVGVRHRLGNWAGRECVGRLEPIFAGTAASGAPDVILAHDGYALGALEVDADQYVDAVALVFMRLTPEGDLDPSDSYTSDWIGKPTGKRPRTILPHLNPSPSLRGKSDERKKSCMSPRVVAKPGSHRCRTGGELDECVVQTKSWGRDG
jgi:hypothetical protein